MSWCCEALHAHSKSGLHAHTNFLLPTKPYFNNAYALQWQQSLTSYIVKRLYIHVNAPVHANFLETSKGKLLSYNLAFLSK